jgi:hypothetical protein
VLSPGKQAPSTDRKAWPCLFRQASAPPRPPEMELISTKRVQVTYYLGYSLHFYADGGTESQEGIGTDRILNVW